MAEKKGKEGRERRIAGKANKARGMHLLIIILVNLMEPELLSFFLHL